MKTNLIQFPELSKPMMKTYTFNYSLTHKVVRNLRIAYEHLGDLTITFTAKKAKHTRQEDPIDEQFSIDIDYVALEGQEIPFAVLIYTELMQEIEEAALHHAYICYYSTEEIPFEEVPTLTYNLQQSA